eukprot:1715753-Prymnesium_polylepis.1
MQLAAPPPTDGERSSSAPVATPKGGDQSGGSWAERSAGLRRLLGGSGGALRSRGREGRAARGHDGPGGQLLCGAQGVR